MNYNIPMIDFSKCGLLVPEDGVKEDDLKQAGSELYSALSMAGFAYLSNHGIEWSRVDEMNEAGEKFYSCPAEFKSKFELPGFALSYESIGRVKHDRENEDYYEGFRTGGEAYTDEKYQWPNEELKKIYANFADFSAKLLFRLLRALGHGMKLKDREYFCKAHSRINQKGNFSVTKTLRYPPIDDDNAAAASENRIGIHSDKTTLTLLFQDDIGGLQVIKDSGKLVDVHPIPGAIVLNVGDTLEAWSGNRLKATKHRVTVPRDAKIRGRVRRSVAYFAQADETVLMKKLVYEDNAENDEADDEAALTINDYMLQCLAKHVKNLTEND